MTDDQGYTFDLGLDGRVEAEADASDAPPGLTDVKWPMNMTISFSSTSGEHRAPYNPSITVYALYDRDSQVCSSKSTDNFFLPDLPSYCVRSASAYFFYWGYSKPASSSSYAGSTRVPETDSDVTTNSFDDNRVTWAIGISAGGRATFTTDVAVNCAEKPDLVWASRPLDYC